MNLIVVGVNYKTAPLPIREKLTVGQEEYIRVLSRIRGLNQVTECALLSTCNRTELHVFSANGLCDTNIIEAKLCEAMGLSLHGIKKYFYVYEGINAVHHIMRVASGMDSMILGEDQILGQFKKAYEISMKQGASKSVLNTLSRLAITSSKRIKTRNISAGKAMTVADQVEELLLGMFGEDLTSKHVLIIGSGEVGNLVSENLLKAGLTHVLMTRRNLAVHDGGNRNKVIVNDSVFNELGVSVKPLLVDYQERYNHIDLCDIIIGATASPHYTVTRDMLELHLSDTKRKRLFIDLAVPRDFDDAIRQMDPFRLFNIDDLKTICLKARGIRSMDMRFIQDQINSYTAEFLSWMQRRTLYPGLREV